MNKITQTETSMKIVPALFSFDHSAEIKKSKIPALIKKANRITLIGTGSSYHVALWSAWLMREFLGKSVQVMTSWDYIVSKMKPQKDEFTIVISHRGKKGLTEKVLKCLKNQPHLLLANENASHAGHPFIAVSPEEGSCAHTQSLFGAMGVISELTAQAADAAVAKKLRTQKKELTSLLDELLKEVFRSGMGCEFSSKISRHIYFVGGGPFHMVALELALKVREMARVAGTGFGLEEILHGPLVSLGRKDHVMLLPTMNEPADKEEKALYLERTKQLIEKIQKTGCSLSVPRFNREITARAERLGVNWQALLYLYWGQWYALGLAYKEGKHPDFNPFL